MSVVVLLGGIIRLQKSWLQYLHLQHVRPIWVKACPVLKVPVAACELLWELIAPDSSCTGCTAYNCSLKLVKASVLVSAKVVV